MLFRIISNYFENTIKPINSSCGQNARLLNVKAGGACVYIFIIMLNCDKKVGSKVLLKINCYQQQYPYLIFKLHITYEHYGRMLEPNSANITTNNVTSCEGS
jgi:hypothetical protein